MSRRLRKFGSTFATRLLVTLPTGPMDLVK